MRNRKTSNEFRATVLLPPPGFAPLESVSTRERILFQLSLSSHHCELLLTFAMAFSAALALTDVSKRAGLVLPTGCSC